ncbi:MAG TPA: short-chain dehydrogenase, partial [Flavobacteriaceae bacterium]|nr:short-chain dehydrogenase [Flavobacteriaceae bacterium]
MIKNIVITGTSRGIGYELVALFTNAGHNVLALSRNEVPISGLNISNCQCMPCDITNDDDLKKVSYFLKNDWKRVDVLINNSGYLVNKPFAKLKREDFQEAYDVNVFGAVAMTQTVLPFMKKDSHVVSISSMGGVQGSVKFPGLAAYSSSKGALI